MLIARVRRKVGEGGGVICWCKPYFFLPISDSGGSSYTLHNLAAQLPNCCVIRDRLAQE